MDLITSQLYTYENNHPIITAAEAEATNAFTQIWSSKGVCQSLLLSDSLVPEQNEITASQGTVNNTTLAILTMVPVSQNAGGLPPLTSSRP